MNMDPSLNVLGTPLESCSMDPVTGFFRNGCYDLSTPRPEFGFAGLKPGDQWCLCASRFAQAHDEGAAPRVNLGATHQRALDVVSLDVLQLYALPAA